MVEILLRHSGPILSHIIWWIKCSPQESFKKVLMLRKNEAQRLACDIYYMIS